MFINTTFTFEVLSVKSFDQLPKSIKKTIRYINQEINSVESLENLEKTLNLYIKKKKEQLKNNISE